MITQEYISEIPLEYMHAKAHTRLKGTGGIIDRIADAAALKKSLIALPEYAQLLREFELRIVIRSATIIFGNQNFNQIYDEKHVSRHPFCNHMAEFAKQQVHVMDRSIDVCALSSIYVALTPLLYISSYTEKTYLYKIYN